MALPQSCASCVFYATSPSLCRRHAASPGETEHEFVHWPKVPPTARCGVGAEAGEKDSPALVVCQDCVHWHQPNGEPITPRFRQGRSVEWWSRSGHCTRFAPSPSPERDRDRAVHWRITEAADSCGDGERVEITVDGETGEILRREREMV